MLKLPRAALPLIGLAPGPRGNIPAPRDRDYAQYLQVMRLVGATTTIAKPFKPRDLFALIRQCLDDAKPLTI